MGSLTRRVKRQAKTGPQLLRELLETRRMLEGLPDTPKRTKLLAQSFELERELFWPKRPVR